MSVNMWSARVEIRCGCGKDFTGKTYPDGTIKCPACSQKFQVNVEVYRIDGGEF